MRLPNTPALLALMALALALFHGGGALLPALAGVLIFGALALLRPDLGLLFVPLTAPLYLIPAVIPGLRADSANPFRLPVHEVALLIVAGSTTARWAWRKSTADRRARATQEISRFTFYALRFAPHTLFLLAGVLGVALAAERGRALRELRWLIVEPLLFYALVKLQITELIGARLTGATTIVDRQRATPNSQPNAPFSMLPSSFTQSIVAAFILSGAIVGLIGLLQFVGVDIAPLLGQKECFAPDGGPCTNIIADGGVRRVLSVYGHPNNLGLYLGRVWPLAAALAAGYAKSREQRTEHKTWVWFLVLCSFLCLGGIVVSFSRGAWLGALAALAVLALGLTQDSGARKQDVTRRLPWRWLAALGVTLAVGGGLALSLRGDVTAGSTPIRLLLWREAAGYIGQHPLGIGLDQFGYYHDPSYAHSLIDPALIGSSEQYAAHPHNLLLDIWLRLGPPGLAAFGWLLARCWRGSRGAASSPLVLGALAALVAALAHGMVDNFYFVPDLAIAFWLLIALIETDKATR
jgi:hypothetical protein